MTGDAEAETVLAESGAALGELVVEAVPRWITGAVGRIVDAWVAAGAEVDAAAVAADTEEAARAGAAQVARRLEVLLGSDLDAQGTTPLEIVRAAVSYPTGVLHRAGVAPVERDAFAEERFPGDLYGLTPASLAALDPRLREPALAWGAAKARAHRARHGGG